MAAVESPTESQIRHRLTEAEKRELRALAASEGKPVALLVTEILRAKLVALRKTEQ